MAVPDPVRITENFELYRTAVAVPAERFICHASHDTRWQIIRSYEPTNGALIVGQKFICAELLFEFRLNHIGFKFFVDAKHM